MELPHSPFLSFSTILALVFLITLLKNAIRGRRRLNLPPGPKPWPIIGNLNLIGPLPHRSIHSLTKKYGPLMQLRFGSFPVVVGSSPSMARLILKTHDLAFADRPKIAAGKHTAYNYSDITWSDYGPYWRQARKMCITELFSTRRLDSYENIRSAELRGLLRRLFDAAGEPVLLKDYLTTLSLNVISRMVFGRRYLDPKTSDDESAAPPVTPEEFKKMLDELFLLNGVLNIGDSIPWLNFLDLQGYIRRMKAVGRKLDGFMEHVIDEHIARRVKEGESFVARDMVDVLIQFAEDPTLDVKLNRSSLKAFSQEELQSLEGLQPVSRCCKEVEESASSIPDPLIPIVKKGQQSCRFWKWLGSALCFPLSHLCCHCPKNCSSFSCIPCRSCCSSECCRPQCKCASCPSCASCLSCPPCSCLGSRCFRCPSCRFFPSCCRLPRCCRISFKSSCCRTPKCTACCPSRCMPWRWSCCCIPASCCRREASCGPRCPDYSCGCIWSCPKCTEARLCGSCCSSKSSCVTGCLC